MRREPIQCPKCNDMFALPSDLSNHIKRGGCERRQMTIRYRRMLASLNKVDEEE